jgi:predicted ATPase/DNA-binding winged helix-turn-helix (wHTH) protein
MTITQFGRFQLDPDRRKLLADGLPVHVGRRAFDVLNVLIDARGAIVTKDDLFRRVWRGTEAGENTLQFQISTLRKALGPDRDFIKTISGRGYRFIADIATSAAPEVAPPEPVHAPVTPRRDPPPPNNLVASPSDLIGREALLADLADLVAVHPVVTLVGAGGIGKTRLALELARGLLPRFAGGVWIAELGLLSDPDLVLPTVAAAIGLAGGAATSERLAAALASKPLLVVLDNCQNVVDAAARLVEALPSTGSPSRVIATSREPLKVDGEWVYRVPPLDVPPPGPELDEDVLRHSAVRLFVARAQAGGATCLPDPRAAAAMANLCRCLKGIPLAIELAAARVGEFGIDGVAVRLDERFSLLMHKRRIALTRHQTLRVTLNWSNASLPEPESAVMRRVAVFAGDFSSHAAAAVAASDDVAASEVARCLAALVTKSLVVAGAGREGTHYRLHDAIRAHALGNCNENGELESAERRHAEYHRDLFMQMEAEWDTKPAAEWLADYSRQIDNVRVALDWAFSRAGDASVGVGLTIASEPLWMHLSLLDECRGRVDRALANVHAGSRDRESRMRLLVARAGMLMHASPFHQTADVWTEVLELARTANDTEHQLRALWGLFACRIATGEFSVALKLARQFYTFAIGTPDWVIGDRLVGVALHFMGDQTPARRHIERMLAHYVAPVHRSRITRLQFDQRVTALGTLARILWLQGFPDQAMRAAQRGVEEACASGQVISLCNMLGQAACPVALFAGDLEAAERFVTMLLDASAKHRLGFWGTWGRCWNGMLLIQRGDGTNGLRLLRGAAGEFLEPVRYPALLGPVAEALARDGEAVQGLAAVDEALTQCDRTEERWGMAELLRIRGELLLLEGTRGAIAGAEDHFLRALDWARWQGALAWELRCAMSLARLRHAQGRTASARMLLAQVYDRFTEGFASADLDAARTLLAALQ